MKMNRRNILVTLAVMLSALVCRADGITDLFVPVFSGVTHKVKHGIIKGQKLKGRFDGMGLIRYKNGDIYYGDVSDGMPHGKGVYVCDGVNQIDGCPGAAVYIGRFRNGTKTKGICLSEESEVVYEGAFSDNIPSQPLTDVNDSDFVGYFGYLSGEDWCYIGQVSQEIPHGKGVIVFNSGDVLISDFNNGSRTGIGLYISSDGEWQTEKAKGGDVVVMSSSAYYAAIDSDRSRKTRESIANALNHLGELLQVSAGVASQISDIRSGRSDVAVIGSEGGYNPDEGGASSSSKNYRADYEKWESRAEKHYNSITNIGSSYTSESGDKSGSAGRGMSAGKYGSMKKSFREAKRQMRSIRRRAAKDGVTIEQSKWETATISY